MHRCFGFQLLDCEFSQRGSAGNFLAALRVLLYLITIVQNKDPSLACGGPRVSAHCRNFNNSCCFLLVEMRRMKSMAIVGEGGPKLEGLNIWYWHLVLLLTESIQLAHAVSVYGCGKYHPLF